MDLTAETPIASTVPKPFGSPSGPGLWWHKGLELPPYIQHVAHALLQSGRAKDESAAIHMAVGIIQDWARGKPTGGGRGKRHVHPDVKAAAAKALAEWEAKRAYAHTSHASHEHSGGIRMTVDLATHKHPSGAPLQYEAGRKSQKEGGTYEGEAGRHTREAGTAGKEELDTQAQDSTKKRLIKHLRNVHRLKGGMEHQKLSDLHDLHARDHASGEVAPHSHPHGLEPRHKRTHAEANLSNFGVPMHFDPWGRQIDLATKTVEYPNGTRVVHHSEGKSKKEGKKKGKHIGFAKLVARLKAKGHSDEEAKRIAASIGRKKYGAAKFQEMAARSRRSGAA